MRRSRIHKTEQVADLCKREIARFYGLTGDQIDQRNYSGANSIIDDPATWARAVWFFVLACDEEYSAELIAEICNRDVRTVKFGIGRVGVRFARSPGIEREVKQIMARCRAELDKFWEKEENKS